MKRYVYYRVSDGKVVNRREGNIDVERELQDYGPGFEAMEVDMLPEYQGDTLKVKNGKIEREPKEKVVNLVALSVMDKLKLLNFTQEEAELILKGVR